MRLKVSLCGLLLAVAALAVALWLEHRQLADANERLSDSSLVASWTYAAPPGSAVGPRILKTLQEAYSDVPSVSMTYDEAKNELQVFAPRGEIAAIEAAMDVMAKATSADVAAEQAASR